ncbi:Tachykinin-like peptides receptor 99D [Halotydeus destructor]|nr:Tachykinin-like peptides receptor 99D [Halotydeus destructor]
MSLIPDTKYMLWEWAFFIGYLLVAILAFTMNGFVLYTIYRKDRISNTYKLIANQAVSDVMCGVTYFFAWFVCSKAVVDWNQGQGAILCDLMIIFKVSTYFVSVYTMMIIALDRYVKLYYPSSSGLRAKVYIPVSWVAALITATINEINFPVGEFFTPTRLIGCRISMPNGHAFFRYRYNYLLMYFGLLANFVVSAYCYFHVAKVVSGREAVGNRTEGQRKQLEQTKRNTVKMLIAMTVCYFLQSAPLFNAWLIATFVAPILPECNNLLDLPNWYYPLYFSAVLTTVTNPILLCYFSSEFRRELSIFGRRVLFLSLLEPESGGTEMTNSSRVRTSRSRSLTNA